MSGEVILFMFDHPLCQSLRRPDSPGRLQFPRGFPSIFKIYCQFAIGHGKIRKVLCLILTTVKEDMIKEYRGECKPIVLTRPFLRQVCNDRFSALGKW